MLPSQTALRELTRQMGVELSGNEERHTTYIRQKLKENQIREIETEHRLKQNTKNPPSTRALYPFQTGGGASGPAAAAREHSFVPKPIASAEAPWTICNLHGRRDR